MRKDSGRGGKVVIPFIEHRISDAWLAFVVLWWIAGIASKRSVQVQTSSSRLFQAALVFIGAMLIFNLNHWFAAGWLTTRIIPQESPFILGGAILTIAGMLFCVWARAILGTNWSARVTIKEHHELV